MNHLYLLCKKYLVSYQEYIDRLDDANDIPIFFFKPSHLEHLPHNLSDTSTLQKILLEKLRNKPPITNKQTGRKIAFFRAGIQSSLKSRSELVRKLYLALPEMLEVAILDGFENNEKRDKKAGILGYRIFKIYVQDNNLRYLVKIKVDEPDLGEHGEVLRADGYYYHGIEEIKQVG